MHVKMGFADAIEQNYNDEEKRSEAFIIFLISLILQDNPA